MENVGMNLARLVSKLIGKDKNVLIGVGIGNNGGGGLVAARRLLAWGYTVYLDVPDLEFRPLARKQFDRVMALGAQLVSIKNPAIFIDAYLGFNQRYPLNENYTAAVRLANYIKCIKISLDIPTGYFENLKYRGDFVQPDIVCTLAAPKKMLFDSDLVTRVLVLDVGIPQQVFDDLNLDLQLPFDDDSMLEVVPA